MWLPTKVHPTRMEEVDFNYCDCVIFLPQMTGGVVLKRSCVVALVSATACSPQKNGQEQHPSNKPHDLARGGGPALNIGALLPSALLDPAFITLLASLDQDRGHWHALSRQAS